MLFYMHICTSNFQRKVVSVVSCWGTLLQSATLTLSPWTSEISSYLWSIVVSSKISQPLHQSWLYGTHICTLSSTVHIKLIYSSGLHVQIRHRSRYLQRHGGGEGGKAGYQRKASSCFQWKGPRVHPMVHCWCRIYCRVHRRVHEERGASLLFNMFVIPRSNNITALRFTWRVELKKSLFQPLPPTVRCT